MGRYDAYSQLVPLGIVAHVFAAPQDHAMVYELGLILRGPKRFIKSTSAIWMFIYGRAEVWDPRFFSSLMSSRQPLQEDLDYRQFG